MIKDIIFTIPRFRSHGHDRRLILCADAQDQIVFVMLNPLSKKHVGGWVRVFSDEREVSLWSATKRGADGRGRGIIVINASVASRDHRK